MKLFGSKKGILGDAIAGIILLFVFVVTLLIYMLILTEFNTAFTASDFSSPTIIAEMAKFVNVLGYFDYITVVIMVVLILGSGIISKRIASAPVFFLLAVIGSAMMGFVSYFFNHLFAQFVSQSVFNAVIIFFPRSVLIATNLHWVALAIFAIGSITLYGKREKGQFIG